jgi:hypothetical protein
MDESVRYSDREGFETLSTKYLCNSVHSLVEELYPLQQNAPSSLECLYLGHNVCAGIDRRTEEAGGRGGGAQWVDRGRPSDGVCNLTFVRINIPTWFSSQHKLDRHPRHIGPIVKSVFKHFDRRARMSRTCEIQYLRTAILQFSQYPADSTSEPSNQYVLFDAMLLVNIYEDGGKIIRVTDNIQFSGIGERTCTHK